MRRFFSTWLALIVIAVFALAMLVCEPLLTKSAERTAQADLNALLDAAFAQFDAVGADAEAVARVSEGNVLAKARAVARFLAHDDALLQTDALVSLCEMLGVSAIDVTDYSGLTIASSVTGRIGRNLTGEPATNWTKEVLDGESVERTRVDETDDALLWGCVPRTDTEGFVLVQSLDAAILTAHASTEPELVLREFTFINDELAVVTTPGSDGAYIADGRCYVRRTQDVSGDYGSLSLVASRALNTVYVLRNAVLLALSVFGLISLICALVIQVLLLRGRRGRAHIAFGQKPLLPASLQDEDPLSRAEAELLADAAEEDAVPAPSAPEDTPEAVSDAAPEEASAPGTDETAEAADDLAEQAPPQRGRKRRRGPRKKVFELVVVEPADDEPEAGPQAADKPSGTDEIPAPSDSVDSPELAAPDAQTKRATSRSARRRAAEEAQAEQTERGFDKIF